MIAQHTLPNIFTAHPGKGAGYYFRVPTLYLLHPTFVTCMAVRCALPTLQPSDAANRAPLRTTVWMFRAPLESMSRRTNQARIADRAIVLVLSFRTPRTLEGTPLTCTAGLNGWRFFAHAVTNPTLWMDVLSMLPKCPLYRWKAPNPKHGLC